MKEQNRYVKLGVTVFLTVGAILLFYDTLFGSRFLPAIWRQFLSAVQPIVMGALIAYLLAPVVNFFEDTLFPSAVRKARERGQHISAPARAVSLLLTWVLIGVMLYVLASVLLPELYKSVVQLINNVENYYLTISGWVQHLLETNPTLETWVAGQMDTYYEAVEKWLKTELLPQAQTVMVR